MSPKTKWRPVLLTAAATIVLDLITKTVAIANFSQWKPVTVIPGFFDLILTYNPGVAFSLLSDLGGDYPHLIVAGLAALALLPFIYFYKKAKAGDRLQLISLGLVWGGALGNIHDRLRWGAVVDFFDFYIGNRHWPAFNVADIAICVGAALLAIGIFLEKPDSDSNAEKAPNLL